MKDDIVGIGFRWELAREIVHNVDHCGDIQCLELIAEDFFRLDSVRLRSLRDLCRLLPTSLHGVSLGLASTQSVDLARADGMARLCDVVEPRFWSEHLSFVRADGAEIGHLAAPPRNADTLEGALANIERLKRHVGSLPVLENIAVLFTPPCSTLSETEWLSAVITGAGTDMLLDLHNLYANAVNTGMNPLDMLNELPIDRVRQVHLSGGKDIRAPGGGLRRLDDHVHDVPVEVFQLLEHLASRSERSLTVIIERDGRYPPFHELVAQVQEARAALTRGRGQLIQAQCDAAQSV
ncbi:DUF692 domain-containing protein [Ramlibacter sp. AW1]|uniref:DUF692 domain-containing protein n=1 Tax=Ramlibacter aurantiacus TaxID=2801330 RepID=A0A937D3K8_9BURK|nr:DUF692 family multinuclear iron-containing protein [Ramlibacter aurantiacus]MBL0419452.1 DUF692 domain-containing protein [Ramlibacter aurantiacus]